MKPDLIRLAIVDDHTLFRKTLRTWLAQYNNIEITIDASNGYELLERLKFTAADVVLLDLFMPRLDGKETLKILADKHPQIKVVVVSMSTESVLVNELLELGIYGFIAKNADPTELLDAIYSAQKNAIYQNKILTNTMYWRANHSIKLTKKEKSPSFTPIQKRLLELLWQEMSSEEIARNIFISVSAVEKIKQRLKEKIGVKTTLGLIKYAIDNEVIVISKLKVEQEN